MNGYQGWLVLMMTFPFFLTLRLVWRGLVRTRQIFDVYRR